MARRFIEDAVKRGAVAVLGAPELAEQVRKLGVRLHRRQESPPATRAHGGGVLCALSRNASPPSPAPTARRRSRISCGRSGRSQGRKAASLGTLGIYSPSGHVQLGAHDARSGRAACSARAAEARRRRPSRARSLEPRARSVPSRRHRCRGRRFHQHHARSLDYHPTFARLPQGEARPVRAPRARRRRRGRQSRCGPCGRVHRGGGAPRFAPAHGRRSRRDAETHRPGAARPGPGLVRSLSGAGAHHRAAACRVCSRPRTRWSPPVLRSASAIRRTKCSLRSRR